MSADPLIALSDALSSIVAKTAASVVAIEAHRTRASGVVWRPGLVTRSSWIDARSWVDRSNPLPLATSLTRDLDGNPLGASRHL